MLGECSAAVPHSQEYFGERNITHSILPIPLSVGTTSSEAWFIGGTAHTSALALELFLIAASFIL